MKWPFVRRFKLDAVLDVNQVYLDEINRLNEDLAKELNSHRETKEELKKSKSLFDYWQKKCLNTERDLDEMTENKNEFSAECEQLDDENERLKKEKESLFQAYDNLNQQNMSLLFELQEIKDKNNQLIIDKNYLRTKIKGVESDLSKLKVRYTEVKQQNDWFYGNYCRFKDMIEKSGYFNK